MDDRITALFLSADHTQIAIEIDGGEGGVFVLDPTPVVAAPPTPVSILEGDWTLIYEDPDGRS